MSAYYNEIDPYAAEWLRNLIKAGHIADGVVDTRSIVDVRPEELFEFNQCHFFAGIGVWSHALRSAGWDDDRAVWTGSCPCQPFSQSGTRKGMSDERHLWPHWHHLIAECRPSTIFGEQVASKDGLGWLDLVQADMEGEDYAFGAFDMCSAGFGAPHIRQRLWFVADTTSLRLKGVGGEGEKGTSKHSKTDGVADTESELSSSRDHGTEPRQVSEPQQIQSGGSGSGTVGVGDTDHSGSQRSSQTRVGESMEQSGSQPTRARTVVGMDDTISDGRDAGRHGDYGSNDGEQPDPVVEDGRANETNGFWSDADWLLCRDGKWRPVRPESFPLAHGATARVGRLRAYGNAITAQVAQGLIETYIEEGRN